MIGESALHVTRHTHRPYPKNPQALNRYTYGYNNPLYYTDPTGHVADAGGALCGSACWEAAYQNYLKYQQLADTAGDAYHGSLKEYSLAQAAAYYNRSQQDAVQNLVYSENLLKPLQNEVKLYLVGKLQLTRLVAVQELI